MVDMEGYRAPETATGADSAATTGHESWIHRPWVPWAAGAVAFTLTMLAGMVVFADAVWRNVEMQNFLERVEASEQAMQDLQEATAAAFEDHSGEGQQQKLDAELRSLAADAERDIAAAGADVSDLMHGPTMATNAIVEDRLAPVALIATQGFSDTIEIGRQNRRELYRLDVTPKLPPLVPADRRFEVAERVDAQGRVLTPFPPASDAQRAEHSRALLRYSCEPE